MRRRDFLRRAAAGAAVATGLAPVATAAAAGANETVRVGLIGCGGRGRFVAEQMQKVPGVAFTAVCDVFETNRDAARQWVGSRCFATADFRQVLDRRDVDAVLVATPDHWHAIPTVLACQAGKDVYVEKPVAHNIREGRAMVNAARKYERIVQTGTQQRSAPHIEQAQRIVSSGELGPVHFVRIWNYRNETPEGIGRVADSAVPEGLDWDMYLGPAPKVPFNQNRFLGNFRWFWDYAGGQITDWGTHRFDTMHQVLGVDAPRSVVAAGGKFAIDDDAEMPNVLQVTYEYDALVVSYEASSLNGHGMGGRTPGRFYYRANGTDDRPHGLAFYGTEGTMFLDRLGFEIYPELKPENAVDQRAPERARPEQFRIARREGQSGDSTYLHCQDFITCVRTRERPRADIAIGHRSSVVPHLGNIAYRTGAKLRWDAVEERFADNPAANELLGREARAPWDWI